MLILLAYVSRQLKRLMGARATGRPSRLVHRMRANRGTKAVQIVFTLCFLVPGFAKFVVIKKPATKSRKGTNPFTGEPMMFKAKPARKIVRARPVKAAKDAV